MSPIKSSRWYEWWHGIGADAGKRFKLPFFGRQKVLDAYLMGLHDAACIVEKHRWTKADGFEPKVTNAIKALHAYHSDVERTHS